ncbi:MAG TPA: hypothetical protein VIE89_04350 [Candidatus Binatia bacterium]|jgi:hypothetical protein
MSDRQDEKLDAMLRARKIEPASADLAQRIILKAQSLPQNQTIPLWDWLRQLFAEFHLPRPAYVFAFTLILGFVIGFNAPLNTTTADNLDTDQVQGFLYADEAIL